MCHICFYDFTYSLVLNFLLYIFLFICVVGVKDRLGSCLWSHLNTLLHLNWAHYLLSSYLVSSFFFFWEVLVQQRTFILLKVTFQWNFSIYNLTQVIIKSLWKAFAAFEYLNTYLGKVKWKSLMNYKVLDERCYLITELLMKT